MARDRCGGLSEEDKKKTLKENMQGISTKMCLQKTNEN